MEFVEDSGGDGFFKKFIKGLRVCGICVFVKCKCEFGFGLLGKCEWYVC